MCLNSRTGFTVLFVYFGAVYWSFGKSGCRGDRSIKPKVSWMIGSNISLILSWLPCLFLRNGQNGNNEVRFFFSPPFIHLDVFNINYAAALFQASVWAEAGFVMKDSIKTGNHLLNCFFFFSPPYIHWQFTFERMNVVKIIRFAFMPSFIIAQFHKNYLIRDSP